MLQIAPSGYWRHAAHQRNPQLRGARAKRDETLVPQVERVWQANKCVYGADKVWHKLNSETLKRTHGTLDRFMNHLGQEDFRRSKVVRTTLPEHAAACPSDRVKRQFKTERLNTL